MKTPRYSDIVDRIDIDAFEQAIGFEPIRIQNGNDVGYCFWPANHQHGDTTGKFAIHREKKVYNCFVCGGGNLLSLVMELYDYDEQEAITWLRQFLSDHSGNNDDLLAQLADVEKRDHSLPFFNERVLDRFVDDRSYFRERGISDEVMDEHNLRYGNRVQKTSPLKRTRDGATIKEGEDYWGPAAIFPHYWQGRLVGWQHRWMEWDRAHTRTPKWLAKYSNTSDFPKRETLFNYDEALRSRQMVIICESIPTVLFLKSNGYCAVGYFGSIPTPEQLRLLRRFSQGVVLAPDNDENGDNLITTAGSYLERFVSVFLVDRVAGKGADLGDLAARSNPHQALTDHLETLHELTVTL